MARKPFIAGNWKMYKTAAQAALLVQSLDQYADDYGSQVDIVVAPPFTALNSVSTLIELDRMPVGLAAQNVHWEDEGAFTGEVSCPMLTSMRVGYVIVGHSERREYFGESDEIVRLKARAVAESGMTPIICCGESLETREAGQTDAWVTGQVRAALDGLSVDAVQRGVIAYEPIWAIGTGRTATPAMAQEVCSLIRDTVSETFGEAAAQSVRILYGGSVKPENAAMFFAEPDVDGALVGGASLDATSFGAIIRAAAVR